MNSLFVGGREEAVRAAVVDLIESYRGNES
jgi:hypothetical protein